MRFRKWAAMAISLALVVGLSGCGGQANPSKEPEKRIVEPPSPARSPKPEPKPAPTPDPVFLPQPGGPESERQHAPDPEPVGCERLTKKQVISLLVKLTTLPRDAMFTYTDGDARAVYREEADAVAEGWPPFNSDWMGEAWVGIEIQAVGDRKLHVSLQTSNGTVAFPTEFELTCTDMWRVSRLGYRSRWFAPEPPLPGQSGALTEELALALVEHAHLAYGALGARVYTTGSAAECSRQWAVAIAGGASRHAPYWNAYGAALNLVPQSPDRVLGKWQGGNPSKTGATVLFVRDQGLWKVANEGFGENWEPADIGEPFNKPMPIGREDSLLGIRLNAKNPPFAPMDETGNPPFLRMARKHGTLPGQNGIGAVDTETGASMRGLKVGDTVASVRTLYGEPTQIKDGAFIYTDGKVIFTVKFTKDAAGVDRVSWMTLELVNK